MFDPFLSTMLLAFEAQKVVELRFVRMAWCGSEAHVELQSMVSEKVGAAIEATSTLMKGGSTETVIARYREHVATNDKRLRATRENEGALARP